MVSNPRDCTPLDVEREWMALYNALDDLAQRELVALERLEEASLRALRGQLRRGEYHIFHFIGHGIFVESSQGGVLILENEQGQSRRVSGQDLGMLLHDHRPLRLAFLNACEGARASESDPFTGVAQNLVQQRIPAVVAMQFRIADEAAIALVHEFYSALADGYPIDASLAEARKAVSALGDNVDWGAPALYMRSPDGRIFDVERAPPPPEQVSGGLVALTELMRAPEVQAAVIAFRADFQTACEQINMLGSYKQLHDLFQDLENLCNILESERHHLITDQRAWEGLMLHEPEFQGVTDDLLKVADRVSSIADDAWWTQQLDQVGEELRLAVETLEVKHLEIALRRLNRVLDREPSRINTRLVTTADALRLADLGKVMATVRDSLVHTVLDLEAGRQLAEGIDALVELDNNLTALVRDHNRWQEIDDELRRVEANLGQDITELKLAWPDLKPVTDALCGDSTAKWATSLKRIGTELDSALIVEPPVRIKMLFLRYRSQASRRFQQVNSDLLNLCQDLQKIGQSLDLLIRTMQ